MPSRNLPNYLRTHRKRSGFSQEEIAFLLGRHSVGQVSRYEHFRSIPCLRTALAYHAIFHASPRELFKGTYQKVERAVSRRAERLAASLDSQPPSAPTIRKLARLRIIATMPSVSKLS